MESYTMTIVLKILFINACFLWNYMETTFSPSPYQFDYNHAGNGVYCFKYAVRSIPRRMRIPYDNGQTKRYVWRTRYRKVGLMLGTCCPGTYGKRCQHSCFDCQRFKKIEEKLTLMEGNVTMMSDQSAATETCAPGTKGPMGYEGAKGYKGQKGEPGLQGSPGVEGRPGRRGPQGPQGPPGKPGLPGQDGQPGKDGNTGQRGQKGVPGFDGPKGERGERGRPGSPGLPGGKGVPGEPGKAPLSLTDISAIKKKIELIQSLPNSKGVPGDPGRKGSRGLQGPKGQKGDNGSSGYTGKKGERGQKGEMGLIGLRGDKGEKGIQGLPGINGQKGLPGFPGLEGIKGSPGKSGRNGIKGDKGLPGDKGAKGDIAAFPFSASEILDLKNRIKKLEELMKMCGDLLVKSITNSSSSTMKTSEETTTPALSSTEQIAFYKTLSTEEINGSGEAADLTFVLPTPASLDTDVYNCENTEDVTDLKNFDWMSDPPPLPPWKKNVILSELKKRNSNCTKSCLTYAIYFYENTS